MTGDSVVEIAGAHRPVRANALLRKDDNEPMLRHNRVLNLSTLDHS